jgi:alanine racemase
MASRIETPKVFERGAIVPEPGFAAGLTRPDLQAHIYTDALLGNLEQLRRLCRPAVKFCAVVKANAYGHGLAEIVNILKDADVDFFAVASPYEALYIAPLVRRQSVLILEPLGASANPDVLQLCAENRFHWVISSLQAAQYASSVLAGSGLLLNLHVNVETGMGRAGADPAMARRLIEAIRHLENLRLAGAYTHFATADEEDLSFAYEQLAVFQDFVSRSGLDSAENVLIHAANSAATIKMPQAHFDMVRCGIALYGYFSRRQTCPAVKLVPVMKLQAPIVYLKTIPKGHPVGYGRSFVTQRDTLAAIIPIGYADGYRRSLSNKAHMKLRGAAVPVIGRVCMDQLLVDATDVPDARVGDMITVIDNCHESVCSPYALAELAGTICYEILTGVAGHVRRIVH